jgi:WS/DGAT/MGAT family acyltransferase
VAETRRFERRMSHADALMWLIEKDPVLRSTIVALAILDRPPDWDVLRRRIERATLLIPRLRQRVASPPLRVGTPYWVVDRNFDLDFHLRRAALPAPADERTLLDYCAPLAAAPFDRARPLWEFTVLEGLSGGRCAVALKVHHSVTDGVGGMELLTTIVDAERDAVEPHDRPAVPEPDALSGWALLGDAMVASTQDVARFAVRLPGRAIAIARATLRHPIATTERAVDTARSIARTVAPASHPLSPRMRDRGLCRRLDSFDVALDDVKRAAKAAEGSINDTFVAAVAGGLDRYHRRHRAPAAWLRMTMPINLRTSSDPAAGNQFAPARFPVPVGVESPAERIAAVRALVRGWRQEPALAMTDRLAGVLNRLPTSVTTAFFGGMLKCVDFTTTNVPGAPIPVFVAGARVDRFYAFAPPAGSAINIALVSHVDHCCVGIVTDTAAVPDTDALLADLRAGFDEVLALG